MARSFYEALTRSDWPAAYDALDPGCRTWLTREQFAGRAQSAMRHVGFTPAEVNVAVSEKGDEASAVAVFRDGASPGHKQYRDGTALRRTGNIWGVILRQNFGAESANRR